MDDQTLNQKQADDFEAHLETGKNTFLIVAVQHKTPHKNFLTKIPCKRGVPMIGHVYDSQQDSYFLPCVDFLPLGYIHVAAYMKSKSNPAWKMRVPVAASLIESYLENTQRMDLKHFTDSYNPEEHTFHYLQLIDPNESYPPVKPL